MKELVRFQMSVRDGFVVFWESSSLIDLPD